MSDQVTGGYPVPEGFIDAAIKLRDYLSELAKDPKAWNAFYEKIYGVEVWADMRRRIEALRT